MLEKTIECWSLSREMEFMCSLALGEKALSIPQDIDWQKFEALVDKNRIDPLVADGLKQFPQEVLRQYPVLEQLYASKNTYSLYSMLQMQTLALVMNAFETAGIRAISMKGPILAMELYGNPALRYSKDLDVFVSEEDYDRASEQLEALGFQESSSVLTKTALRRQIFEESDEERHLSYVKDDIQIELHWRYSIHINKNFDELWENRCTKVIMGQKINCFGRDDNLVYLICHAAGHGFCRLRWLFDIYELQKASDFSWENVYKKAKETNVAPLIIETMMMLYLIPQFGMKNVEYSLFYVSRNNGKVYLRYMDSMQTDVKRGCGLVHAVYAKIFETGLRREIGIRKYDYYIPIAGKEKSVFRFISRRFRPCATELQLIDLPDSLYFLYYIIRPLYKIWQVLPFSKKSGEK